ncbi:MAG: hypothetical protein M1819_007262 [Sarea resinae]|nr:MAG: hypothetical protein M1819_007262 [Sarea resinae]
MRVRREVRQELAHALLVELMAYQFASPVQWIKTQDILLGEKRCERIIEVGPADTLTTMLRRTLSTKYKTYDAAHSLRRELLSLKKNTNEIYYDLEDAAEEITGAPETSVLTAIGQTDNDAGVSSSPPEQLSPEARPHGPAVQVPDCAISAGEIAVTIIAHKLKISVSAVLPEKTIKSLAGGRSTLENEIIGDLSTEFGSVPEKAEEASFDELCHSLSASFDGRMGKVSSTLIDRMQSSKMPGGFNLISIRNHLSMRWGFGPGRQDGILLLAVTMQPSVRLGAEIDAKAFLDGVVESYAVRAGVRVSIPVTAAGGAASAGVVMDPEVIKSFTKDQRALSEKLFEAYASHLQVDLHAGERSLRKVHEEMVSRLENDLDQWNIEHGEAYATGIRPHFDAMKVRTYDSCWNWVLQDLVLFLQKYVLRCPENGDRESTLWLWGASLARGRIINRADSRVLDVLNYMIIKLGPQHRSSKALQGLAEICKASTQADPLFRASYRMIAPCTSIDVKGNISYAEIPRRNNPDLGSLAEDIQDSLPSRKPDSSTLSAEPLLHLKRRGSRGWQYSRSLTEVLRRTMDQVQKSGTSFKGKTVLITGAGSRSIGAEVLHGILAGGAKVLVTTSHYSSEVVNHYQSIYSEHGAPGSSLAVVPFNQGSSQDIDSLAEYIYDTKGLGWDLDHILPFAAISENGHEIDDLDSRSELAHRIMLTNTLRLLGAVKAQKQRRRYRTRPTQIVLPLSPNHGDFGGDGLYSESKAGLETLFNRWYSENWGEYLSICGVVIGWTRGTGLMTSNDVVSEGMERLGVRTFSQQEMAFGIICLMSPTLALLSQHEPVYADLNGAMDKIPGLKQVVGDIRKHIQDTSELRRSLLQEQSTEKKCFTANNASSESSLSEELPLRADFKFDFPPLPNYQAEIAPLAETMKDMVDLERVVVITGFAEVGPYGSSRTRWEMEAFGEFSLEGCIELAWVMGLITHHVGLLNGTQHAGWIDATTKEPISDKDIKQKYEKHILDHSGIRLIEPNLFEGYDPRRKQFLHEIIIQQDLDPIQVPEQTANQMRLEHGDKLYLSKDDEGQYMARLKKGARLMIPKAMKFNRLVAGQIPTGWNARTYGIPEDIISQVDPVCLYVLVTTVEALLSAGITDPYELYQYIHVSEVGNCIGSGLGGISSLRKMHRDRFLERDVQKDVLQETFINVVSAWVNMLLLSSSGPIRTPVGACATSIESLDLGHDTIVTGKAKFCLVGGYDDFGEDPSYEFANMNATSNSVDEFARGRTPKEMSRPATSTRSGFMESHGCGLQVLTSARLALDMGLPIYGVVALTSTASDKVGRSVPAPGKGILSQSRESPSKPFPSPMLNIQNRKKRLEFRRAQIREEKEAALEHIMDDLARLQSEDHKADLSDYRRESILQIENQARRQEREAQDALGNSFWKNDPRISPIRGALATWGLTIDDLDVASFHGTSTRLNEKNECDVMQRQLSHLGRAKGNTILGVFQKYLTGHPKGAAGAWMLNGCLQSLTTGLVPGNRNGDNIDSDLRKYDFILFPNRSIQTTGIKAVSLTSFGFGQKGAQAICVHPRYLFATVGQEVYEEYSTKVEKRQKRAYEYFHHGLITNSLFQAKTHPPFPSEMELEVLLNPTSRIQNHNRDTSGPASAAN